MKGYRERIKNAGSLEEAKQLLEEAKLKVSEKALRRCITAFNHWQPNQEKTK